jgi:hypothetical protein
LVRPRIPGLYEHDQGDVCEGDEWLDWSRGEGAGKWAAFEMCVQFPRSSDRPSIPGEREHDQGGVCEGGEWLNWSRGEGAGNWAAFEMRVQFPRSSDRLVEGTGARSFADVCTYPSEPAVTQDLQSGTQKSPLSRAVRTPADKFRVDSDPFPDVTGWQTVTRPRSERMSQMGTYSLLLTERSGGSESG